MSRIILKNVCATESRKGQVLAAGTGGNAVANARHRLSAAATGRGQVLLRAISGGYRTGTGTSAGAVGTGTFSGRETGKHLL